MKETKFRETVYHYPGATVTVRRPELSPEEYDRRFERLKKAAASIIRESERAHRAMEAQKKEA